MGRKKFLKKKKVLKKAGKRAVSRSKSARSRPKKKIRKLPMKKKKSVSRLKARISANPGKKLLKKKILKRATKVIEEMPPKKPTKEQKEEMKKTIGILSDAYVRQVLIEVGGENALAIIRNFYGNHSDEELAKKLKIKISDVRATLNKLHNEGLVNYIRQKDNETGWYSYSWSLNHERMEKWATDQTDKINGFGNGNEEKYYCPSCGTSTITAFEEAACGDFRCVHCNRMLEFLDKTKVVELFEKRRLQ